MFKNLITNYFNSISLELHIEILRSCDKSINWTWSKLTNKWFFITSEGKFKISPWMLSDPNGRKAMRVNSISTHLKKKFTYKFIQNDHERNSLLNSYSMWIVILNCGTCLNNYFKECLSFITLIVFQEVVIISFEKSHKNIW